MNRITTALALIATAAFASIASASPTSWDVPAGSQTHYDYTAGQNANNNFGTGATYGDGFYFIPGGLRAQSFGSANNASDTASVILNAKPNMQFTRISSSMLGDFTIFNGGDVNATGLLHVTNLDTSISLTAPLAFGGTMPKSTTTSAEGVFDGDAFIDLPAGWTNIKVDFDALVSAASSANGTALAQVKDAEISVETATAQIPLPAAVVVAPLAAFVGMKAKRKLGL